MSNQPDKTTKMSRHDINQDHLSDEDQQRTDDSVLNMMSDMHDHEDHDEDETDDDTE